MSHVLTDEQVEQFWRDGVLVVANAVSPQQLQAVRADWDTWVEESRNHDKAYGDCIDGRPRFDLQPGHSAELPQLRRAQAPSEVSAAFNETMSASRMTQMVADLIGPNVKQHHNKINSKQPGSDTEVKWHQDFLFTPHTNDDLVTALLMLDDVTEENGPLEVVVGSHKGELHSLWHDGKFTGSIATASADMLQADSQRCLGPAGSVCLMHTRLAHASTANRSTKPRTLYICVYSAEDAIPCSPNPVPNAHEGLVVAGTATGKVRTQPYELRLPEFPKQVSFFSQQSRQEREQS